MFKFIIFVRHFSCVEPRRNYSSTSLEYLDQLLIDDIDDQNQVHNSQFLILLERPMLQLSLAKRATFPTKD